MFRSALLAAVFLSSTLAGTSRSLAYTPDSPEVKQMVSKLVATLNQAQGDGSFGQGQSIVRGYAVFMAAQDENMPAVRVGVKNAVKYVDEGEHRTSELYEIGVTLLLLSAVSPSKYRTEVETLIKELYRRQTPEGAWNYLGMRGGDVSQSQFGLLGLWQAKNSGFKVNPDVIARCLNWFLRVQDASGGWCYQPEDPGGFNRIRQSDEITHSMTSAGLGCVYIASSMLNLQTSQEKNMKGKDKDVEELPPALVLVRKPGEEDDKAPLTNKVDIGMLHRAKVDGVKWFSSNFKINPSYWTYYYMYGYERYASFRELAEDSSEESPAWYNQGVEFLRRTWKNNGFHFAESSDNGELAAVFGLLFLVRSTKKTIGKLLDVGGDLLGGNRLPSNDAQVKVDKKTGRVIENKLMKEADELMDLLEESPDFDAVEEFPENFKLSTNPDTRKAQIARFRRVVRGAENYKARMVGTRVLGSTGDLANVPILLFALTDPDPRVMAEARDALRFISRKFEGFRMPDKLPPGQRRKEYIDKWKAWYVSVQPDALIE